MPPSVLEPNPAISGSEKNSATAPVSSGKTLTNRQQQVLGLVAQGMSNKQIAYELGLSEGTVKLHVTAILKLLNVNNRTGAVREAERLGVIRHEKY